MRNGEQITKEAISMCRLWTGSGLLFLLLLFIPVNQIEAEASESVRYYFNQERVPEIEQMIYTEHGRTMVPFRLVFELLDARVEYVAPERKIVAESPDARIIMTVGERAAEVNGEPVTLDVAPVVENGRTFVPLRFVSEGMGAEVVWNGSNRSIHVLMTEEREETLSERDTQSGTGSDSLDAINAVVDGLWDETVPDSQELPSSESKYGFEWLTDSRNPFTKFGVDGHDEVVGLFTMDRQKLPFHDRSEARAELGEPMTWLNKDGLFFQYSGDDTWDFYESDAHYLTLFYAPWDEDRLVAVQLIEKEVEQASAGYYGGNGDHLASDFEQLFFHTVNAIRKKEDLSPLEWLERLQPVAAEHSKDMAENDSFSHSGTDQRSPFDRIREADIDYTLAGENLARNHLSPFHAAFSLMNSDGHRKNILQSEYSHTAVGVAYADQKPYVTQKFIKLP